jgi:hypothetical protein
MKALPFFGNGMAGKSFTITRQRRLNCYIEQRKDGDKEAVIIYGTPGLTKLFTLATANNGPIRGMYGTDSSLYAVAYNTFYSLYLDGTIYQTRFLTTASGRLSMVSNGPQLLIVDGTNGYVWTPSTNFLTTVSPWQATGAQTCTYVQGFFVAEQPNSQNVWVSAAYDATTWNALSFLQASQFSDNVAAVDNTQGMLVVFGLQHMEFFQNSGATPQPFVGILNAANSWGLAAVFSRQQVNNSIIFLGETPQGTRHVCQLLGLTVSVISDPDMDYILNTFTTFTDAVALSYVVDGHPMYQITFPSATPPRSFLYDLSTGFWSEAQTGVSDAPTRHTADLSAYAFGTNVLCDYATPTCYSVSSTAYTDAGTPIKREIVSRHISQDTNVIGIDELMLDMETGVGIPSGQGAAPQIMLQVSTDNGHTFGLERWAPVGVEGNYTNRVIWRRLGSGRDFVIRLRMTDPVKFAIAGVKASIRERPQ